ncbi:MAG TPA: alanine--glyoxylate aminotransferase family protein, partial [Anaerolineaceae bacterium]
DVYLMVGSGTTVIDAGLGSAFYTGEKVIVGVNGFFGERLAMVARSYGLEVVRVDSEWGQSLRPQDFQAALERNPDARAVCVVHLETSTAVINPIEEIGALCRRYDRLYLVDAVSSLGGLPVRVDDWGIDLCASCSQKCLGAPPGIAPLSISPRAWQEIDRAPGKNHGWYGDLRIWRSFAEDAAANHPTPITMATSNVAALRVSLESLLAEGIDGRVERYRALALRLRGGLRQAGMQPYTPDECLAPVLTAAYGPDGVPTGQIVAYLASHNHIRIAGGLGRLKDRIFRIGHMSPTTTEEDIDAVVQGLEQFSREMKN